MPLALGWPYLDERWTGGGGQGWSVFNFFAPANRA
jgi:hypothetical protein